MITRVARFAAVASIGTRRIDGRRPDSFF